MLAVVDWGAIGTFLGVGTVILGAVLRLSYLVGQRNSKLDANTKAIERNARHIDGIMATVWPLIWRVQTMEDYLEARHEYLPPKLLPPPPENPK